MIVSIHQPQFLPWLGYFDKIDKSDTFIFLDNVQFKKNEWQNRNRIKTAEGWQWLTIPVIHHFGQKINGVKINNTVQWGKKHLNALTTNYSKSPYFKKHFQFFQTTYSQNWEFLSDLNIHIILYITETLGFSSKKFFRASEFDLQEGNTERLIDICQNVYGNTYLSGKDGVNYLDSTKFEAANIKVIFQDYKHPVYAQLFGQFESNLSVVDLLFNCGPNSTSILKGNE